MNPRISPKYPKHSLKASLNIVATIYESLGAGSLAFRAVAEALHSSTNSTSLKRKIASLIRFALLERRGGPGKELQVTALAMACLNSKGHDRVGLLQKCLRNPDAFAHIIEKFGHPLPDCGVIAQYLKKERGFAKKGAEECAKSFMESATFAQVESLSVAATANEPLKMNIGGALDAPPMNSRNLVFGVRYVSVTPEALRSLTPEDHKLIRRMIFSDDVRQE